MSHRRRARFIFVALAAGLGTIAAALASTDGGAQVVLAASPPSEASDVSITVDTVPSSTTSPDTSSADGSCSTGGAPVVATREATNDLVGEPDFDSMTPQELAEHIAGNHREGSPEDVGLPSNANRAGPAAVNDACSAPSDAPAQAATSAHKGDGDERTGIPPTTVAINTTDPDG